MTPRFTIPSRPTEDRQRERERDRGSWCSGLGSCGSGHLCGHCVWGRDDGRTSADVGHVGLCARSHRGDACSVTVTDTCSAELVDWREYRSFLMEEMKRVEELQRLRRFTCHHARGAHWGGTGSHSCSWCPSALVFNYGVCANKQKTKPFLC